MYVCVSQQRGCGLVYWYYYIVYCYLVLFWSFNNTIHGISSGTVGIQWNKKFIVNTQSILDKAVVIVSCVCVENIFQDKSVFVFGLFCFSSFPQNHLWCCVCFCYCIWKLLISAQWCTSGIFWLWSSMHLFADIEV